MKFIMRLLVSAVSIYVIAYLMEGISLSGLEAALIAAFVLGLVNTFVRPIIKLLALPITIATLGLFSLIINAAFLMLTANLVAGFEIDGFFTALLGSILLSFVNMLIGGVAGTNKK